RTASARPCRHRPRVYGNRVAARDPRGPGNEPPSSTFTLDPVAFVYIVGGLLLSAAVFGLFHAASSAITTVAVGVLLALALDPVVSAIRRRWHWPRPRAVLLVMGG